MATTTTSKVLDGDFIFSIYTTRIYPVGSKNNTFNINEAVFDIHVRKVVVVFTPVWAAHVSAKLSALFLPVQCVCDIGCAKGGYTRKNTVYIYT